MNDFNIIHSKEINVDAKTESQKNSNSRYSEPMTIERNNFSDSKSTKTVETLIQMNELANEKLKISLRRLSLAENEISNLKEKTKEIEDINLNLQEQIYIYKEKDKSIKASLNHIQEKNEILKIQYDMITTREEELKQEVARLRKYQEKINTQVKPYFKQLKEYSKSLELQTNKISDLNEHKEVQIKELKSQIAEIIKNYQFQVELQTQKYEKTLAHYEDEISVYQTELKKQQDQSHFLKLKLDELEGYHQKFLETENKLIETERYALEKKNEQIQTIESLNEKIKVLTRSEFKFETENKDLKLTTKSLIDENNQIKEELFNSEKQLESLKYLWEQKSSENARLKSAMDSLEKINIELSKNLAMQTKPLQKK